MSKLLLLPLIILLSTCRPTKTLTLTYYDTSFNSVGEELTKQISNIYNRDASIIYMTLDSTDERLDADTMTEKLALLKKDIVVGLTSRNLFKRVTELSFDDGLSVMTIDRTVLGFSSIDCKTAIVSNYLIGRHADDRHHLISTVLHEIGHLYRLTHCSDNDCFMQAVDFEKTPYHLCKKCKKKLVSSKLYKGKE